MPIESFWVNDLLKCVLTKGRVSLRAALDHLLMFVCPQLLDIMAEMLRREVKMLGVSYPFWLMSAVILMAWTIASWFRFLLDLRQSV